MKTERSGETMKRDIRLRMESGAWDQAMAAGIAARRRRNRLAVFAASGSAVAALALVVLLFGLNRAPQEMKYRGFITSQIEGTYKTSFENNLLLVSTKSDSANVVFADDLGSDIDDIMLMRK
jgi:hypothetical protein